MSELNAFDITVAEEGYYEGSVKYRRAVYDKSEVDKVIDGLRAQRDVYEDDRDCLQAELDELKSEREALGQIESAATYLLENYSSGHPTAGEVYGLAEDITQLLTEKYNISRGII